MLESRKKFLELVKKRAPVYRGRDQTIIERKIDKMLGHEHVLLESVQDVTKNIKVPYALVGGHAVSIHGTPRMTEDIDLITSQDHVDEIVSTLKIDVKSDLTIGGVAGTTPDGFEIDVIAPDQPWVGGLLSNAENSKHGLVVSKPYLVLTKIWASRGTQDDADIINIISKMTDEEKSQTKQLVDKYFSNMLDDIESMIEIANYGIEF